MVDDRCSNSRPRVLLLVVDGCTPGVMRAAMDRGELPTFARLASCGWLDDGCTTIFPSITPAATASIITGRHPAEHGIAGMSWLNPRDGQVSYFGDDVATVMRRGPADFFCKFLVHLNGDRLLAPTLMQTVSRHGLTSASINYLVFKGDQHHNGDIPRALRLLPRMPRRVPLMGPPVLFLGEFSTPAGIRVKHRGLRHRFGLDDAATEDFLLAFPDAASLPSFSVAYFADYDFEAHRHGPMRALEVLRALDARLARVLEAWGGVERVLRHVVIVMTADHCHSDVRSDAAAGIDLEELLDDFQLAVPAYGWREGDEIMLCPNMRAAQVHLRRPDGAVLRRLARRFLSHPRVDQVLWRGDEAESNGYHVMTADRGNLYFRRSHRPAMVRDRRGEWWDYAGELEALDGCVAGEEIRFGDYPDAFGRIVGGLNHLRGDALWVTAQPGFEFAVRGQKPHRKGSSHGALHRLDSMVPLLVAAREEVPPLAASSVVDVEPLCRRLLHLRAAG